MVSRIVLAAVVLAAAAPAQASLNIASAPTSNMSCAGGTCTATAKKAVLNVDELQTMLAAGDVTVATGAGAITIEVTAPLTWASSHRLTLDADHNVSVKAPVAIEGLGGFTAMPQDEFLFFPGGKVDFWDTNASLIIQGQNYALVNGVSGIAAAAAATRFGSVALARDYDAGPDGTYANSGVPTPFDGRFNGLGHTISNFSVAGTARLIGLFSQSLSSSAKFSNLTLSDVHVAGGNSSLVGALAGGMDGTVINVHSSGLVSGGNDSNVGGLAGTFGTYVNASSSATIKTGQKSQAGGLVGNSGSFRYSHAAGSVTVAGGSLAGGLTPITAGVIDQSYATGDITSSQPARSGTLGGLVGLANQNSKILNSYATGAITNTGVSHLGGLAGSAVDDDIIASYSTGAITREAARNRHKFSARGGSIGRVQFPDTYDSVYWDIDTSGFTDKCGDEKPKRACDGIKGLSDTALKSGLPAGFDPAIWGQSPAINDGYPYLLANLPE